LGILIAPLISFLESIAIAKAFGEFAVHVTCKMSVVTYID